MRYTSILVGMFAVGVWSLASAGPGGDTLEAVDASVGSLPCTPIGVEGPTPWGAPPWVPGEDVPFEPPAWTVVVIDIRPDRARLYLDDRFIGRADDFDGRPDVMYLEPGRYLLEARLGGYRTDRFEIVADAGCRHEIRHWLERVRGERVERRDEGPPSPFPVERMFSPVPPVDDAIPTAEPRHDAAEKVRDGEPRSMAAPSAERATLRLRVIPVSASVTLDGEFLASGAELARVQGGLAVDAGVRVLSVAAPGYRTVILELELAAGEVVERVVELELESMTPGTFGD